MPELPEVEFARRCLERWMKGEKVVAVSREKTRVLRGESLEPLVEHRVESVERRGKTLLLKFDQGLGLIAHLGMTGKFLRRPKESEAPRFSRAYFETKKERIHLSDQRLFGRLLPGPLESLESSREWSTLGPDAWSEAWTGEKLRGALGETRRAVKVALMDQARIAGLGNIQAGEALWKARIDPKAKVSSLSDEQFEALARAIRWTLERTLEDAQGDEITYVEEDASKNPFVVYAREGSPCPRCKESLQKESIAGRSTFFCPRCQR